MKHAQAGSSENNRKRTHRGVISLTAGIFCLQLSGCGGSGNLNIFGAYFPVWLLAIIIGVAVAFACRYLFVRFRIEPYVGPLSLIYVCITISVACLVWLLFA